MRKLFKCSAMFLISSKLETSPRTHEAKTHQCLPRCLWRICPFEVHKYGKNQGFEEVKDKHTAQES